MDSTPAPSRTSRRIVTATLAASLLAGSVALSPAGATPAPTELGSLSLLTDPYLQLPSTSSVHVAWVTEFPGTRHVVVHGDRVAEMTADDVERIASAGNPRAAQRGGMTVVSADSEQLSRTREDAGSNLPDAPSTVAERPVWRHVAEVSGLAPGQRDDYRVISVGEDGEAAVSDVFTLAPAPKAGDAAQFLLTSDHQSKAMTPANMQKVVETVGQVDAVLFAGDLVNVPDRASEWFDDAAGGAFFPALQGNASRPAQSGGPAYTGGEILQHAPVFPVIGNHEVMGRVDERDGLNGQFNRPVPREVAEAAYEAVAHEVNPGDDPAVREQWIEDNSFSTTTYEDLFDLPSDSPGGETYWATTLGDVRVIGLYATRIWRTPSTTTSGLGRFVDPVGEDDPLRLGHGSHVFEDVSADSEQLAWLADELASPEFRRARYTVVVMHHAIHSLGDNVMTPFTDPVRIEERDEDGELTRIRYEYPKDQDVLVQDLDPMLREAGVDLVLNGHSHLWNRFEDDGVTYLETSNVGNNYGAYLPLSGRSRNVPPAPWDAANYTAQGDPAGLDPVVPTVNPFLAADGTPEPYVASNEVTVFSILDTGDGMVTSYAFDTTDPEAEVVVLDRFPLGEG